MEHPPQQLASLVERRVQEGSPVEVEEVEGEDTPPAGPPRRRAAGRAPPDPPGPRRRPPRARRRGPPSARRAGPPSRPAPGAPAPRRGRPRRRSGRRPRPVARPGRRTRTRAARPRPARTRGPANRRAPAAGAEASAAGCPAGSAVAGRRARAAARAGRASSADGSARLHAAVARPWSSSHPFRAGAAAPARPRRATIGGRSPVTTSSHRPARRSFRPEDLYRFRIATEPRLSPDGRRAVFTVQTVAPTKDGYRHAALDGRPRRRRSPPTASRSARSTIGRPASHRTAGRWRSCRTGAILVEEEPDAGDAKSREDGQQIHLLPLDGGEARRLTDLPRGVDAFEWSPDGRRLLVTSSSHGPNRAEDHRIRGKTAPPKPGEAARVRLPLRRPARLPLQRPRLRLPRGRAALAGRRRDR